MIRYLLICYFVYISLIFANSSDLVKYDTSTQSECIDVIRRSTYLCPWKLGLYDNMDYVMLKGKIAAYKIQWFSGHWSGWYVPGVNDLDHKFNIVPIRCGNYPRKGNTLRRMWSYFFDHNHRYILCK